MLMCGTDAVTTPVVCTSGLEIEFYPNLTPESDVCDIYRDATISADIGHFEQYRNGTYPTRPDHIRLRN